MEGVGGGEQIDDYARGRGRSASVRGGQREGLPLSPPPSLPSSLSPLLPPPSLPSSLVEPRQRGMERARSSGSGGQSGGSAHGGVVMKKARC